MILLWGPAADPPLAAVRERLRRRGAPARLIDQRDVLASRLHLCVDHGVDGWVRTPDGTIELASVTAAYLRPYDPRRLPAVVASGLAGEAAGHAVTFGDVLWSWADLTPALVVNRPEAMASNNSKPYQLGLIRQLGFAVPATLVTTDPEAVAAFRERHGDVIYKSVSGTRSIVARLRAADQARLADLRWCPTQFQEYIAGTDYRVHVVGDEVFACAVVSEADDYRYPGGYSVDMRACRLPPAIADRCRLLTTSLRLSVAGIDLRHSPDGRWYCFEVNPSPGFTAFENATRQPIGEAIARLLAAAS